MYINVHIYIYIYTHAHAHAHAHTHIHTAKTSEPLTEDHAAHNFSKVSSVMILRSKSTSELTFEKFHQPRNQDS